jgi:RNA polymerase sigma factor (sigma-70 family)
LNSFLEKKLVASCRSGDKSAYADLVRAYSGRVFAICLGILGNTHDAEDIAQQALLKGFTAIAELRDSERFGVWIGRIAKNLCTDFLRRQGRKRNAVRKRAEIKPGGSKDYGRFKDALARLPEQYRMPLMLYYFDGMSTKNIAETLETSETAIHKKLSRARNQLRKLLDFGEDR